MCNLEHNIKEAFDGQEARTKLADKKSMWNRLENEMRPQKGVALFWRVAALFLGFLVVTGAGAALNMRVKQQNTLELLKIENEKMVAIIDSLYSIPAQKETEIVEKEKIVYRYKTVIQKSAGVNNEWKKKYLSLVDSTETILASVQEEYKHEITQLSRELAEAKQELARIKPDLKEHSVSKEAAPFHLKSERIEVDVPKKPSVKDPEMEMKIFQKNFIENRNNLNRTIFKQ
ncbi:hypothetical protein OU798_12475 [Prolixibacteraceae bacterium Z1-6]|uniref:Uncharacterized protein n=1 Tax=Draconibacterium aestuarii TaxID=2998507 RepID=A0A9X3F6I8_9BACT|nr:hypothetical protein [Prolixibacteraceae bacterium Z1-6]